MAFPRDLDMFGEYLFFHKSYRYTSWHNFTHNLSLRFRKLSQSPRLQRKKVLLKKASHGCKLEDIDIFQQQQNL